MVIALVFQSFCSFTHKKLPQYIVAKVSAESIVLFSLVSIRDGGWKRVVHNHNILIIIETEKNNK